jgi:hypothetical protein
MKASREHQAEKSGANNQGMSLTQRRAFARLRCCLGGRVKGHVYNPLSPAAEEPDIAIPGDHQTTIWGWLVQRALA